VARAVARAIRIMAVMIMLYIVAYFLLVVVCDLCDYFNPACSIIF
jgi:hypothetical protein